MTVPEAADIRWRKASLSQGQGSCVELGHKGAIRDSKNPAGAVLDLPWLAFVAAVRAGRLTR